MKKTLLLLLTVVLLLVSCTSKKETCAQYSSDQINMETAFKRLGLKNTDDFNKNLKRIADYCSYYK